MADFASHLQVKVLDELDAVGYDVALQITKARPVFLVKVVIQALRQHHCKHVLNVEKFSIEEAKLVDQLKY